MDGARTEDETFQNVRAELQELSASLGLELDLDQALLDHEDRTKGKASHRRVQNDAQPARAHLPATAPATAPAHADTPARAKGGPEAGHEKNRVPAHKRRVKRHRTMTKDTMLLNDGTGKFEIFSISFDVFSPEERASLAVREITESKLYDNGVPQDNGPMSYYLGSYRASHYCQTCDSRGGAGTGQCTGHYGIVKFPEPVFHPLFFKDWTCKFLSMCCFFCGHPTRDWTRVTAKTAKRAIPQYLKLPKLGSSQHALSCCPNCEARAQPDYECQDQSIIIKWPEKTEFDNAAEEAYARQEFTCKRAHQILEGVPRWFWQDVLKLQSHPKDICVLTSMLVPPTLIRPSIIKHNSTGEMDLTKMLCDIVKFSNQQRAKPDKKTFAKLQQAVNMYHDKDLNKSKHLQRVTGPMKAKRGLIPQLGGKQGCFRRTLMGKRLNSCARCVITADPTIDIDKVRVPMSVAMKLTVAEIVNDLNRAELVKCIRVGMASLGGAHYVTFTDGSKANLRSDGNSEVAERVIEQLHNGCIVHRMLKTGDLLLFNRQPTLSKFSIMGFDAIVDKVPGIYTLRLNPVVCKPFNADFDGDEMTIYIAQSLAARSDLRNLVHLRKNIMSGADNKPIIGCAQDSMSGIYKLTHPSTKLPLDVFMDIAVQQRYPKQQVQVFLEEVYTRQVQELIDGGLAPREALVQAVRDRPKLRISGRKLIDLLFPEDFCYAHDGVVVHNGKIPPDSDPFMSTHAGSGANSVVAALCLDYNQDVAVEFLSDVSRVTNQFMTQYEGFSVSMSDLHVSREVRAAFAREMRECMDEARAAPPQDEPAQERPLSIAQDKGIETVRQSRFMSPTSGLGVMIRCGAKGSSLNARQLIACVGPQIIGDSRPKPRKGRTLTCFPKHTYVTDPCARGFASYSYVDGLSVVQFIFHALAGRVGLLETACTTADSGYLQRRSSKWVENTAAGVDGTIRTRHQVLCFNAVDGLSPHLLERYQARDLFTRTSDPVIEPMRRELAYIRKIQTIDPDLQFLIPLNLERKIQRYEREARGKARGSGRKRGRRRVPVTVQEVDEALDAVFDKYADMCLIMQKYHAFWVLRKKRLFVDRRRLDHLCKLLDDRIVRCILQGGEPVGPEAAQSISKDTTQKTLNSFHRTGDVLLTGISRVRELIEHVPSLCYVIAQTKDDRLARSKTAVEDMAQSLLPVYLRDVMKSCEVTTSVATDPLLEAVLGDISRGATHFDMAEQELKKKSGRGRRKAKPPASEEPQHAVFTLDVEKLRAKQLTLLSAYRYVEAQLAVPCSISALSEDEPPTLTLHFGQAFDAVAVATAVRDAEHLLLRGFKEVKDVIVKPRAPPPSASAGHLQWDVHCLCRDLNPFYLSDPSMFKLDSLRCNNVTVMANTYGIESALHTLFCELKMAICGDGHVNNHHLYLFSLHITNTGRLLAITRHGMSKSGSDCLQRASFEQPKKVLTHACLFGEQSRNIRRCVSSSTIIGSVPGIGTGACFVYADPSKRKVRVRVQKRRRRPVLDAVQEEGGKDGEGGGGGGEEGQRAVRKAPVQKKKNKSDPRLTQTWDCARDPAEYLRDFYVLAAQYAQEKKKAAEEAKLKKQQEEAKLKKQQEEEEEEEAARRQQADAEGAEETRAGGGSKEAMQEKSKSRAKAVFSIAADPITDFDLQYMGDEFNF